MSSLPARPAAPSHRAQLVTEAVVSAYLREITPPRRARPRAGVRDTCRSSSRAVGHTPVTARGRTRALAPHRRPASLVATSP
jgi:hypothetical protein